jgi:hypothetical protein
VVEILKQSNHMQILYLNEGKVFTWNFKDNLSILLTMFIAWWISEGRYMQANLWFGEMELNLVYCIWFCEYHHISFHSWFMKSIKRLWDNFAFHLINHEWKYSSEIENLNLLITSTSIYGLCYRAHIVRLNEFWKHLLVHLLETKFEIQFSYKLKNIYWISNGKFTQISISSTP